MLGAQVNIIGNPFSSSSKIVLPCANPVGGIVLQPVKNSNTSSSVVGLVGSLWPEWE